MKRFFSWLIVLAACVGAFYCVGLIVPRSQALGSKTNLQTKPNELYALVVDVTTWSAWHPDVAAVQGRPDKNGHALWNVTTKAGDTYELEVTTADEPAIWQGTYTLDEARMTLRFDFNWHGQGGRARVTKTADTRDPWVRARRFFWSRSEAAPVAVLNALAEHLGEPATAEDS